MVKRRNASSNLVQSIKKKKWCSINAYLHEAEFSNATNTYALHQICSYQDAPLQAVKEIYYAHPEAALAKNSSEETPLSIAVEAVFEDAVHFLANACPKASSIGDIDGCTPLLSAVSISKRNNMIGSMIKTNPGAAFVLDDEKESAFDSFFMHWNVSLRIILCLYQTINEDNLDEYIRYGDWKVRDIYEKACLFLKASHICKGKIFDDDYLLHYALQEESCPWAFCKLLLAMHPSQILRRDLDGNLPLHILAACKESSDEKSFLCFDCFKKKSELVHVEFMDCGTKYCCKDCLQHESKELKEFFRISSGMYHVIILQHI